MYLPDAANDANALFLSPNQVFCIADHSKFQCVEKGRKEGHSFAFALDAVARAFTEPKSLSIMISIDKKEAQEKNRYCRWILDAVKPSILKGMPLLTDSKEELAWPNGSVIRFYAAKPVRGPKGSVYLDELAHMPDAVEIMRAARAVAVLEGYIRAGSTHFGRSNLFYEVMANSEDETGRRPHKNWHRGTFPWWTHPALCTDIELAMAMAESMETDERVYKFGRENLIEQYESYPLEEFQEEFECVVVDEAHAYFPMTLIQSCNPRGKAQDDFRWWNIPVSPSDKGGGVQKAIDAIHELRREIDAGHFPGEWFWAMDVGRHHDASEIMIGQTLREDKTAAVLRMNITMKAMPFEKQYEVIAAVCRTLRPKMGVIDKHAIGEQISETAHRDFGNMAQQFVFTNEVKSTLANNLKVRMQKGKLTLPIFPELARQIHAIRKNVTAAGHASYDVEKNKEHHGDKFWSLCMMLSMIDMPRTGSVHGAPALNLRGNTPPLPNRGPLILPVGFGA